MEHARKLLKQCIAAGLCFGMAQVALANEDKITKGYNTMDSMGCMLVRECKKDVEEVFSLLDISSQYDNTEEFTPVAAEFNMMLMAMIRLVLKYFLLINVTSH